MLIKISLKFLIRIKSLFWQAATNLKRIKNGLLYSEVNFKEILKYYQ